jgi:hypothetical protein
MEIKDENLRHQSTLDSLSPLSIAVTVEWSALPIQCNDASLHAALMASALNMDDTMNWLKKTELALPMLVHHKDIIVDAPQCCLDDAEASIQWLIEHNVAKAAALKMQHCRLVALKLRIEKVKEDGLSTIGKLQKEVENVKGCRLAKVCRDINTVFTAMNTLDENV